MYRKWLFAMCFVPLVHICYATQPSVQLRTLDGARDVESVNNNFRNQADDITKQEERIQALEDGVVSPILAGDNTFTGENTFTGDVKIGGEVVAPLLISAFVKFVGTGTVVIVGDSVNVSSITDFGTGNYRVNFSTPFASVFFTCNVTYGHTSLRVCHEKTDNPPLTTHFEIDCQDVGGGAQDVNKVNVMCIGGLDP